MFGIRDPYKGEDAYFKSNPTVGGMMTDDNKIILNPYSKLNAQEKQAVATNEAIRLLLKKINFTPKFDLTKEQIDFFKGTEYESNPEEAKKSILARILTKDSSAQSPSKEQVEIAKELETFINTLNPKGRTKDAE